MKMMKILFLLQWTSNNYQFIRLNDPFIMRVSLGGRGILGSFLLIFELFFDSKAQFKIYPNFHETKKL
jgi:hypothetical protein